MVRRPASPGKGRLIALEGFRSAELRTGSQRLLRALKASKERSGFSLWDASSIFHEMSMGNAKAGLPSAKTLLILYATDLAFRLRWEIEPALADGYTVVAAPYTATAIAVGLASGLSAKWLANLFDFAPKAERSYLLDTAPVPTGASSGYPEFAFTMMSRLSPQFVADELLAKTLALLEKDRAKGRLEKMV